MSDNDTRHERTANGIAEQLLDRNDDEAITIRLEGDTELSVSIVRALYLPRSVDDDVDGGSLRYAVTASDRDVERLDLPSPAGLLAAEESDPGSWNRSRIGFYEVVSGTDGGVEDYGDAMESYEVRAVDTRPD